MGCEECKWPPRSRQWEAGLPWTSSAVPMSMFLPGVEHFLQEPLLFLFAPEVMIEISNAGEWQYLEGKILTICGKKEKS